MEHFYQGIHGWSRLEDQGVLLNYILENIQLNKKIKISLLSYAVNFIKYMKILRTNWLKLLLII